ncbi:MAG: right-handed parallel beta-helix repeat-containing protein [Rhodoferax sp.]|nr:right-handed parallel beta-helix repeat-containing protein [Rhodoferax sp.]
MIANPTPSVSLVGWSQWSATGNAAMAIDNACPGQTLPCMAFTSGTSNSIAISNNFALNGGVDYSAAVQLRAVAGTSIKVVVRRGGPTYEPLAPEQWITASGAWQNVNFAFRASVSLATARMDIEVPAARIRVNLREAHLQRMLPGGTSVISTFVDGLQVRRAHHPNFGQGGNPDSPYATVASAGGKTTLDASNLVLPGGAALTSGIGATVRTVDWAIEERTVTSLVGKRLALSAPTGYDILPGYGFYLTGALWMLDSPGEWFYDDASAMLYVWMPDGAAPGNRISATGLAWGADASAKANVTLKDLAIRHVGSGVALTRSTAVITNGLSIADTADYGISAENCAQCQVQRSSVLRTGVDAINVRGALSIGFSLTDSTIADSGASTRTDGWRFLPRSAVAAVLSPGRSTTVMRNTITGSARLGVYLGPMSVVTDNYFGQSCLVLNDCGAIYVNRVGNNATIRGNVVEGVSGNIAGMPANSPYRAVGIYIDDLNTGSVVTGNTVTGADHGIQVHTASGNTLSDNMLFGNRRQQLWMQENSATLRTAGDLVGNIVSANVFVPTASGPAVLASSEIGDTVDFAVYTGNHYSALLSPRVVSEVAPTTSGSYAVSEWQAAGRETGARVTQPVGYATFLAGPNNLIPNGSFADGTTGWTRWNLTAPLSSMLLRACAFGPCLDLAAGASTTLLSSPNFSVTAGKWYRVTFDAATGQQGQAINMVVRRGGGGTADYAYLMPAAESFAGSTAWKRYSFAFQATKTVIAGDPITKEFGARVDFQGVQPGTTISLARLEMTTLTPAQAALQIKLLLNRGNTASSIGCATLGVPDALCNSFVYLQDSTPVVWPATVIALSGVPVYTRDTSLTDSDGDGIADQQDFCPNTPVGAPVNARGCAFGQ